MVTVELAANPVPDKVIVEPAVADVGDTVTPTDWMLIIWAPLSANDATIA